MEFFVKLPGKYSWELLQSIDNSSGSEVIHREVELEKEVLISYDDMIRSLKSTQTGINLGLDDAIVDVTSVEVYGVLDAEVKVAYGKIPKRREFRETTKKTHSSEVGANSSVKLYQLVFKGPGVSYKTDKVGWSEDTVIPDVSIEIKGGIVPVVRDIEVLYTDEDEPRPKGIVEEARGHDPDVNGGRGGKSVWLKPKWSNMASEGITGIQLVLGEKKKKEKFYKKKLGTEDGDFRYLRMERDSESKHRITEVALWRQTWCVQNDWPKPEGYWSCKTGDINDGRGGDDLYVVWNSREIK